MTRSGQGKRFAALVAGLEYTHYGVFGGSKDIGLLFEYLYDGRSAAAPPTPFNNDIFVGLRVAFNNAPNTELLVSATIDLDTQATILGLNASRRLHDKWKIEVESRFLPISLQPAISFSPLQRFSPACVATAISSCA